MATRTRRCHADSSRLPEHDICNSVAHQQRGHFIVFTASRKAGTSGRSGSGKATAFSHLGIGFFGQGIERRAEGKFCASRVDSAGVSSRLESTERCNPQIRYDPTTPPVGGSSAVPFRPSQPEQFTNGVPLINLT
jgi:hypothetical protein